MNQCMGCQAGWRLVDGNHVTNPPEREWRFGDEMVACTADRYVEMEPNKIVEQSQAFVSLDGDGDVVDLNGNVLVQPHDALLITWGLEDTPIYAASLYRLIDSVPVPLCGPILQRVLRSSLSVRGDRELA